MSAIEKRTIRREITQTLVLPLDLDIPIEEQCARALIARLKGTPSEWGVMVDDHLLALRIGKYITPVSYGTRVMMSVSVRASYEVVGYIVGDVLFEASLAERLADEPIVSQFRRIDILGLPFQINVRTKSNVPLMNIQIVDSRIEGTLQYIAAPAFYPFYTPLMAHLSSGSLQQTFLYADTPTPKLRSAPNKAEWRLIDPLYGTPTEARQRRIVGEIRRMLNIYPGGGRRVQAAGPPLGGGVAVVNAGFIFDGKPKVTNTVATKERPVIIEFIDVEDAGAKAEIYESANIAHYTFIRVPAIPPLSPIIAAVSWAGKPDRIVSPSKEQVEQFGKTVDSLIKMRYLEMAANRRVYGMDALADPNTGQSPESILLRDHLEAGIKIARSLAAESVAAPGGKKDVIVTEGKPIPSKSTPDKKAKKRGKGSTVSSRRHGMSRLYK